MEELIRQDFLPDLELPQKVFYVCEARGFDELPTLVCPQSKTFGLFIAADARAASDEIILRCAEELVDKGLAYLCSWGPDCEKVHDIFDKVVFRHDEASENDVIMTTWHNSQTLDEAIFFFVFCAVPTESYVSSCRDWVAVSVDNSDWSAKIRDRILEEVEKKFF